MAASRYEQALEAIQQAIANEYQVFSVATNFYSKKKNRNAQSNRIWNYSHDLIAVTLEQEGNKFWVRNVEIADRVAMEETTTAEYREGRFFSVVLKGRERNPKARAAAIKAHGVDCKVCDTNFEKVYGKIGQEYIHVHHLVQVKDRTGEYFVDPINDLKPVCPNCHAMLHKKDPPYSIEEMREIIRKLALP